MPANHVLHDAEADARAAHLRLDGAPPAEERLEHLREILSIDAETAIHHTDAHGSRANDIGDDVDYTAAHAVLHPIADDVLDGRAQRVRVAGNRRHTVREVHTNRHAPIVGI